MTFKTFLAEAVILEGGAAIKGSHPLTQAEAREISMHAVRDLKSMLNLKSDQIAVVGSAGLKAPDQLSGDIDIAVNADVTAVKKAVEELALDGRFRHMPGLNVFSYAKLHGSKTAQVDVIPTTNIKLAKWAYHNDPADLKLGLKGSHRNELLFAIAKYAEYVSTARDHRGEDSARERLVFDLSRGLYRFTQDRTGKRGLKKSFSTTSKKLITSDPDKICAKLFGEGVTAKQVLTFDDALKLTLSSSFKHKIKLKQIIDRAITGLEQKSLVVPHELRTVIVKEEQQNVKAKIIKLMQDAVEHDFDYELNHMNQYVLKRHNDAIARKFPSYRNSLPVAGYQLNLDDDFIEKISDRFEKESQKAWLDEPPDDDYEYKPKPRWRGEDDEPPKVTPPSFPLKNVATMITVGSDGTTVAWCHQAVLQAVLSIEALNTRYYITAHADLADDSQYTESLNEAVSAELLRLQQMLIDDLDDDFEVELGSHNANIRQLRHKGSLGLQFVKLTLPFEDFVSWIYLAPSLVEGAPTNYTFNASNELLSYPELLKKINDEYAVQAHLNPKANDEDS